MKEEDDWVELIKALFYFFGAIILTITMLGIIVGVLNIVINYQW